VTLLNKKRFSLCLDETFFDEEYQFWRARLTLGGENDGDVSELSSVLGNELNGKREGVTLGIHLTEMTKYEQAHLYVERIVEEE
jgi:hypothetical protein